MPRPTKRRVPGSGSGRTTPKGGAQGGGAKGSAPEGGGRYTAPVPAYKKSSPPWVPVLMFAFWGLGFVMILANYIGFVPGDTSNWYLVGGLGLILAGILTATQYR